MLEIRAERRELVVMEHDVILALPLHDFLHAILEDAAITQEDLDGPLHHRRLFEHVDHVTDVETMSH